MVSLDLHVQPLLPGALLGPYTLCTVLARGGMGEVWLARGPEGVVAAKAILPAAARDPAMRALFHEETRIARRIVHANVVRVLRDGEAGGVLFYAMEWVDGASLAELLDAWRRRGQPVDRAVVLRIALDAARGLHAAHELVGDDGLALDVVHRDVSPENLLIASDGGAKVTDFGIALARGRRARSTTTGKFRGRFAYAAPEQQRGKATDRRADIYALAAVICDAFASDAPPVSEPPSLPYGVAQHGASLGLLALDASAMVLDPPVPAPLFAVLRRALARHPDARYATAHDFADALEAASSGEVASHARVAEAMSLALDDELNDRRRMLEAALAEDVAVRSSARRRRYVLLVAAAVVAAAFAPRILARAAAAPALANTPASGEAPSAEAPAAVPIPPRSIARANDVTAAPVDRPPPPPVPAPKARAAARGERRVQGASAPPIREDDPGF